MTAPLSGIRIIEIAGLGPAPFACMMLADHGAEVIRVERPGGATGGPDTSAAHDILRRSRKTIGIDLKSADGLGVLRELVTSADGLVEGFRPGVMERLGLGPDEMLALNPKLVFGRMTGWGQTGPYAQRAGHDINYISLSGALHAFGRAGEAPVPPVNMIGDFGGGGMMLAFGMVAALLHARATGEGQVIDAAMTDGSALLMSMIYGFHAQGTWRDERGVNVLDTGAHFYDVYETADGKHVSIGAIEPQFHAELLERVGLADDPAFADRNDPRMWNALREKLATVFRTKTRDEWDVVFEGSDACYGPILSLSEAPNHAHNVARETFVQAGGFTQPAPAPRYSVSSTVPPQMPGSDTDARTLLGELGHSADEIDALLTGGSVE